MNQKDYNAIAKIFRGKIQWETMMGRDKIIEIVKDLANYFEKEKTYHRKKRPAFVRESFH